MSTITEPGFMVRTMSSVTMVGARPPGTRTAPMTRSASATARSTAPRLDARVMIRPLWIWSTKRSRSRLRSSRRTSACMPWAIHAAFQPTLPAPSTRTRAGRRVVGVGERRVRPRPDLDQHLVAVGHQLPHAVGGEGDAVLPLLGLRGNPDDHAEDGTPPRDPT